MLYPRTGQAAAVETLFRAGGRAAGLSMSFAFALAITLSVPLPPPIWPWTPWLRTTCMAHGA